jgi:plastocyanin
MRPRSRSSRPSFLAILAFALVATAPVAALAADPMHHTMPMTDADMQKWVDDFYATHPRVGVDRVDLIADATVNVISFRFDADGNAGTQVDTVKIGVGESVKWQFVSGSHTVTSGTGTADPLAGEMFDQGINSIQTSLTFQFNNAGLFPYFCRPHVDAFNMKGFVLVQSTSGVTPVPSNGAAIGFTRAPRPNPTRTGVDFQFALNVAGHARIDVYDARGARIATVADRDLPAGSFAARWDGTATNGRAVDSGVYWLQMTLPGYAQSRKVVISR